MNGLDTLARFDPVITASPDEHRSFTTGNNVDLSFPTKKRFISSSSGVRKIPMFKER